MPASRVARLYANAAQFADLDAIVAPERTSLLLKKKFGVTKPAYIHVRHGAGDRAIGFHPSFKNFDLLLLQGEKYVRRLKKTGGLSSNDYALVGYPKFETIDIHQPRKKLFDNDNPTVLYNPHFTPGLSSWNKMGHAVLDYFAANPDLNLVFSPHVMLFKKRLHISSENLSMFFRRDLKKNYSQYKNILIDLDSPKQFDMTYTLNADLYLADISSQVLEFIARPRPCVFLNPNHLNWQGDENFTAWTLGDVVDKKEDIGQTIRSALENPHKYSDLQKQHFDDTINMTNVPPSKRAATAITSFLDRMNARHQMRLVHSNPGF